MGSENRQSKKRKGDPDAAPKPKKQKKSDGTAAAKKSTKALKAAVQPVDSIAANVKSFRKRGVDFFSDEEAPVQDERAKEKKDKKKDKAAPVHAGKNDTTELKVDSSGGEPKPKENAEKQKAPDPEAASATGAPKEKSKEMKKSKKGKKKDKTEDVLVVEAEAIKVIEDIPAVAGSKKSKKVKKSKNKGGEPEKDVNEAAVEANGDENEADVDDQTAALLAGFDSDRDESDRDREDQDFSEEAEPKLTKKQRKALEQAAKKDEPGVVFLGRIPHGFFEPQMKKYFSQFGTVTRLRLSRNKKTGASKHYAFIEFASSDVADIVAQTMNNYLMFGHILQCKRVAPEQVHLDLFKGANQRFKVDPRNKKAGLTMKRGAERAVWEKRIRGESMRRASKAKALKDEFGYEFAAPALKGVDDVPMKAPAVEDKAAEQLLTEASTTEVTNVVQVMESKPDQLTITETVKVETAKKDAKGKTDAESEANGPTEKEQAAQMEKKRKKDKKRKSDAVTEATNEEAKEVSTLAAPPKAKKAKGGAPKADNNTVEDKKRKAKPAVQNAAKPKKAKKVKI